MRAEDRLGIRLVRGTGPARGLAWLGGVLVLKTALSEGLPAELKEGLARARVNLVEFGNIGEGDQHRITSLDVNGFLAPASFGEREEDGISGGEGFTRRQGE